LMVEDGVDPVGVVPARDVGAGCPVSDIDMIRSRDDSQSVGQPADLLDDGGIVVVAPQDTSDPAPSAGMKAKRRAGSAPDQQHRCMGDLQLRHIATWREQRAAESLPGALTTYS
jgi:hypothetical protein